MRKPQSAWDGWTSKRKLSLTHWRGEDNPADGLTKSLKPLSLWTNLVEAVGLVPGPNEKGQNWIRNFLQEIHDEETVKEIAQMSSESTNERKNEMDPTAGSKKGKKGLSFCVSAFHICIVFHLSFSHCVAATEFETPPFEKRCDV